MFFRVLVRDGPMCRSWCVVNGFSIAMYVVVLVPLTCVVNDFYSNVWWCGVNDPSRVVAIAFGLRSTCWCVAALSLSLAVSPRSVCMCLISRVLRSISLPTVSRSCCECCLRVV